MSRGAVFVDRDGTINQLVPNRVSGLPESPLDAGDVQLLPGAGRALAALADAGWLLVGVTNQPGAAKLEATIAELDAVQARVLALLAEQGVRFDDFERCLHHSDGLTRELTVVCDCRKPRPGMLLRAAARLDIDLAASWMVGDTESDVLAGKAAGCRTVLVETADSAHKRVLDTVADVIVPDLTRAAQAVDEAPVAAAARRPR